ncbi:MAG: FkbM family methyltransferase [Bacteroidetes bacterium]|nr:FkbM family methyltransferase [Bacteroidota bacterium]
MKRLIIKLLQKINKRLEITTCDNPLEYVIRRKYHPDFFFVQIGGNDGISFDPLHNILIKKKLAGLIVEPVKEYFDELKITYASQPQVQLANVAIFEKDMTTTLYRVRPGSAGLPEWSKGIASLDPEHHKKSGIPGEVITTEEVKGITLNSLFSTYRITHLDLFQTDTEGYDYAILKMLDFNTIKPSIISFEHGLPDHIMTQEQFTEIVTLLIRQGYKIITQDYDCIAYL